MSSGRRSTPVYIAPPRFNFVSEVLEPLAASRGNDTALVSLGDDGSSSRLGFAEIAQLAHNTGDTLAVAGARPKEAVLTLTGPRLEWVTAMLGAWRIGAVTVPCSPMLRSHDLALRLEAVRPTVVVTAEEHLAELRAALAQTGQEPALLVIEHGDLERTAPAKAPSADSAIDDPAIVIFSSGTTGEPRPVRHVQRYLWGQRVQSAHWVDARPGDLLWCTATPGWSKSTRNSFVAAWLGGAAAAICERRFKPEERLQLAADAGVTILCQAPTEYRMIAKSAALGGDNRGNLRHLISAGEPLDPETIGTFRDRLGIEIHDSYGQTETGAVTAMAPGEPVRAGSMGRALPGFDLKVEDGELWIYAPSVPTICPEEHAPAPGEPDWHRTGDRVSQDEDGYFWFEGRGDDIIISSGYRIGPFEVESALIEHPAVAEAAVVAAPDRERGSIVKAFVVTRDRAPSGVLAKELQDHVKQVTAPYKYPRRIEFVGELPKTASGKVKRAELRERGTDAIIDG